MALTAGCIRTCERSNGTGGLERLSAVVIIGAALARAGVNRQSLKVRCRYRIVLFLALALVGAGHVDARLEDADFLRPS